MNAYFTDFSEYMQRLFPGVKVQKISINAGFSCPNRDGTISTGGCIYCNNASFSPDYTLHGLTIAQQIEEGKKFFGRKYPEMKYLAYFQSFTSTHCPSTSQLAAMFSEALEQPDVVGLVIGTRPDCMPEELVHELSMLNRRKPVIVELGAESSHDTTLRLINRGHSWAQVEQTAKMLAEAGIHVGLHLIAFLPDETGDDVLQTVAKACSLPIESIKMHQLQVLKGTTLAAMIERGELSMPDFTLEQYLQLCEQIVKAVPRRICIERFVSQSPPGLLIHPRWGLKNHEFTNLLINRLKQTTQTK